MRTILRWIGILLAVLAVSVVVFLLIVDWNWLKDYAADKASDALGQPVSITGDIDIDLALKPSIRIEGIRIDNADWSPEPHLLELPVLAFQIDLLKLLQGRLVLPEIELSEPTVRLERSEQGQLNWAALNPSAAKEQTSEGDERTATNLPTLGHLLLRNGRLVYHDYATQEEVTSSIAELTATTTGEEQTLDVKGTGQFADQPLQLMLHTGSLAALETETSVPLRGQLTLGEMQASVEGTVTQPLQLASADLDVSLRGTPPQALLTVLSSSGSLPQALLQQGNPSLEGHLQNQAHTWRLKDFQASLGDSDLAGTLALDTRGKRPALQGNLHSNHLDITALTGGPSSRNAEKTSGQDRVIPDVAIEPASLRTVNAEVNFTGAQVMAAGLTWQDVNIALSLQNGHLVLEPKAQLMGGTVQAKLDIDSTLNPMQSSIATHFERLNLQPLLTTLDLPKNAFGAIQGTIDLDGTGHALATFLDTADGDVVVTMNGGRLGQLLLELADLDLGESIVSAFTEQDQTVPLRCVAIDFNVQHGRMQTETFVIDTKGVKIVGDGFIDLGEEQVDIQLKPQGKDVSAFSADAPIHIQGPFHNLSISTNIGQALLSLATPIETPEASPSNCQTLFERARHDTASKP
jgi:uncharacterized protein involved in outer membrane biogenesis